jgi:hypothetical protein
MSPRILVTVSRQWSDISTMREVLEKVYASHPDGATHCYNLAVGAGLNCVPPYRQED